MNNNKNTGMTGWISVEDGLPKDSKRRLLVTNNIDARNAHGEMSHFWLVNMIHESTDPNHGKFSSFDECDHRLHSITHWRYALPNAREHNAHEGLVEAYAELLYLRGYVDNIGSHSYWEETEEVRKNFLALAKAQEAGS